MRVITRYANLCALMALVSGNHFGHYLRPRRRLRNRHHYLVPLVLHSVEFISDDEVELRFEDDQGAAHSFHFRRSLVPMGPDRGEIPLLNSTDFDDLYRKVPGPYAGETIYPLVSALFAA